MADLDRPGRSEGGDALGVRAQGQVRARELAFQRALRHEGGKPVQIDVADRECGELARRFAQLQAGLPGFHDQGPQQTELQQPGLVLQRQAGIELVHAHPTGLLPQGGLTFQAEVPGQRGSPARLDGEHIQQPVQIHVGLGLRGDVTTPLRGQRDAGGEVGRGQRSFAGIDYQLFQRDVERITAIGRTRQDRQVEALDEDVVLLPNGESRHLQGFDRLDVDRGVGIGRYLEGAFQRAPW